MKSARWEAVSITQGIQDAAPSIEAFQRDRTLMTMLSLYLPELPLHSQLTKVQLNAGAAAPLSCYTEISWQLPG